MPPGGAIPGATVTVTNTGTNEKSTAVTTSLGSYTIAQLPVGVYELHITMANFKEFVSTGVEVHVSTNTSVNAVLEIGSVSEKSHRPGK